MRVDKRKILKTDQGKTGITFQGPCTIGHKRRCPRTEIEIGVSIGENTQIETGIVGMGTFVGRDTRIKGCTSIGRFVTIGEDCKVGSPAADEAEKISHSWPVRDNTLLWYRDFLLAEKPYHSEKKEKGSIGSDVWMGDQVQVLEGVAIGNGAVISSGTVVYKDVPDYGVVAGNPGRLMGYRFSKEQIKRLQNLKWWRYGIQMIETLDLSQSHIPEILDFMEQNQKTFREIKPFTEGFLFRHTGKNLEIQYWKEEEKKVLYTLPQ